MAVKETIGGKVLISKSGDLLLRRRKQELPPSRGDSAVFLTVKLSIYLL